MSDSQGATHYTERMVPEEAHARIFWEHVGRYRFAKDFVRGQRVLDIACGEGYGAAALAKAGAATMDKDRHFSRCLRPRRAEEVWPGRRGQ